MRTNYLYAGVLASLAISLSAPQVNAADATSGSTTSTTTSTTSTSTTTSTTDASTSGSADAAYFKRIEGRYTDFAGSGENLQSLASGLRHGTAITLNGGSTSSVTFTPPTRPMGYGNVSRALDFANRDLAAAGITDPTPEQIQTALMGGTVTGPNGQVTTMDGILQLRSEGMGWGQIAHQVGISPAANAHGQNATLKNTTALSGTSRVSPSGKATGQQRSGIVNAEGSSSGGVTTAAGKTVNAGGNAKSNAGGRSGIVSAAGSSASTSGLSTAAGGSLNGNAYGHAKSGIVSAGGTNAGYSGITTGGGASATAGTHSALGGSGNGNAFGVGKGKN